MVVLVLMLMLVMVWAESSGQGVGRGARGGERCKELTSVSFSFSSRPLPHLASWPRLFLCSIAPSPARTGPCCDATLIPLMLGHLCVCQRGLHRAQGIGGVGRHAKHQIALDAAQRETERCNKGILLQPHESFDKN